jgi:hypothetical protein
VLAFCERNFPVSIGGQDLTFLGGRPRRRCPAPLLAAMISTGAGIRWRNRLVRDIYEQVVFIPSSAN